MDCSSVEYGYGSGRPKFGLCVSYNKSKRTLTASVTTVVSATADWRITMYLDMDTPEGWHTIATRTASVNSKRPMHRDFTFGKGGGARYRVRAGLNKDRKQAYSKVYKI